VFEILFYFFFVSGMGATSPSDTASSGKNDDSAKFPGDEPGGLWTIWLIRWFLL